MSPRLREMLSPLLEHPGLALLRMACCTDAALPVPDIQTLQAMRVVVREGGLHAIPPATAWQEIERGLLGPHAPHMVRTLRDCGALEVLLPEVEALFGVPQSADDPATVDVGEHLLATLQQAALENAPRPVRIAALLMHVGKSDSPREHLPSHYRHMERARPRIDAICQRLGVDDSCRDYVLLALAECERMHRAAPARAGSVAALLARIGALTDSATFELLLTQCRCDFHAYPGRANQPYRKETVLRTALGACLGVDSAGVLAELDEDSEQSAEDALLEARAAAIARALRSERWAVTD